MFATDISFPRSAVRTLLACAITTGLAIGPAAAQGLSVGVPTPSLEFPPENAFPRQADRKCFLFFCEPAQQTVTREKSNQDLIKLDTPKASQTRKTTK